MIMKKNILISLLAICGLLTACNLDTNPTTSVTSDNVYKSTADADMVLNGTIHNLFNEGQTYSSLGYRAILNAYDAMGSDVAVDVNKYGFKSSYQFTGIYGKGQINSISWSIAYHTINNCNNVIANIDNTEGQDSEKNRIKGQAFALRGFSYLQLASTYSFAINKDSSAVCAPIYTQPTDETIANQGHPAASVNEVYNRSISDLEEALTLIPEGYARSEKYNIDQQVVLGLLSRACLYARQWDKAKNYSDQLLSLNNYLMSESEYKSGFNDASNNEWIWGYPQTKDDNLPSYNFYFLDTTTPGSYYCSFNADPYFKDLFNDGDYRKDLLNWGINPNLSSSSAPYIYMHNSKFKFKDVQAQMADIVLMRVSEIYLINAEAKARLNDNSGALESLNTLRKARGSKEAVGLSGQALLDQIWLERRKELWGEGFSLIDIIRNQQAVARTSLPLNTTVAISYTEDGTITSRDVPASGHTTVQFPDQSNFTANSKYYLFRIPDSEESTNKHIYDKHPKLSIYAQ